jgi:hypothetical protein
MHNKWLGKIYDNRRSDSWSHNLRKKRVLYLESLIASIPTSIKTIKILDVGGRPKFWEEASFINEDSRNIEITVINIEQLNHSKFRCIVGDARNMNEFKEQEFDIVFWRW